MTLDILHQCLEQGLMNRVADSRARRAPQALTFLQQHGFILANACIMVASGLKA